MKLQKEVETFMTAAGQLVKYTADRELEKSDLQKLYVELVKEELQETLDAFEAGDVVEVADGIADSIWVLLGLASSIGIDMQPVWEEVTASNMSKTVDGTVIKREDGKILKPDTYFRPNVKRAVYGE